MLTLSQKFMDLTHENLPPWATPAQAWHRYWSGAAPWRGTPPAERRNAAFGEADCSDVMGRAALVNLGKHDWLVVVYPPL